MAVPFFAAYPDKNSIIAQKNGIFAGEEFYKVIHIIALNTDLTQ